jgi:elongation factor G
MFGNDCASGDTFTSNGLNYSMTSMFVPKPVISLSVKPADKKSSDSLSKALNRFCKEDPTFHTFVDPESNQTIIEGMGELHLDVYIERIKREYNTVVETGKPQVAYRETVSKSVSFNYTHKKQTGGAGQYARVAGILEPSKTGEYEFVDEIKGGVIPKEFVTSCDKGFQDCLKKGGLIGFPVTGVKVTINDGNTHPVDSSDNAFRTAALLAFREAYLKASPKILEPIMKVSIEGPESFQGAILASINQRRGIIAGVTENGVLIRVDTFVPLAEMFGYSTVLRSATQGKSEFTMEFHKYEKVPSSIEEKLIEEYASRAQSR